MYACKLVIDTVLAHGNGTDCVDKHANVKGSCHDNCTHCITHWCHCAELAEMYWTFLRQYQEGGYKPSNFLCQSIFHVCYLHLSFNNDH